MGKPDYTGVRLISTKTVQVGGQDFQLGIYMPKKSSKTDPGGTECDAIAREWKACIVRAGAEWRAGLAAGGMNDDDIPNLPDATFMNRLFPGGGQTDARSDSSADDEVWQRFKVWQPADLDWFETCFGTAWDDLTGEQRRWTRNRFITLMMAACSPRQAMMMSTGESTTMGSARNFKEPLYKQLSSTPRDRGDGLTDLDLRATAKHLYAFQRYRIDRIVVSRMRAAPTTYKEMVSMKRKLVGQAPDDNGDSRLFMQTLFHEYSHNYCDANDYYYIGFINSRLRGTRAGDLDKFLKNSPFNEVQTAILRRGKTAMLTPLLLANADSIGSYISRFIETKTGLEKAFGGFTIPVA